ncbi:hypothetical protein OIU85_003105 [Salix viminalis]|uniref:Uncharacterized protein n=1 Tax=Salix viminalis TaxID=40686 RepID=A0A9Q0T0P7_SALVM|nr:hypothetical protein OIU85_003105 [Salix viminalis]
MDKFAYWTVQVLKFFQTAYVPYRAARDSTCCSRHGWRDALALQITEMIRAKWWHRNSIFSGIFVKIADHARIGQGQVKEASFTHIDRPARMPQKILLCGWRRDIDDMIVVWRGSLPKDFIVPKSAERILFCGWRRDMEDMIMVLDAFLAPGSELWMFNDVPENEREKKLIDGGLDFSRLENIQLVNREGNAVIRRHLESLPLHSFDSILILADESVEDSAIQADSRSLATLLLIRDIQSKRLLMVNQVRRASFSQGSWIGEMQHVEKCLQSAENVY